MAELTPNKRVLRTAIWKSLADYADTDKVKAFISSDPTGEIQNLIKELVDDVCNVIELRIDQ